MMTSSCRDETDYDHVIDVVARRDVEDYAHGRLHDRDAVQQVEQALLEDDAARAIIRGALSASERQRFGSQSQGLLFEPLQDLGTAARSCRAVADTYEDLRAQTADEASAQFFRGRATAFRQAAEALAEPLRKQIAEIPDTWPEEAALIAPESRNSLVRQILEQPAHAIRRLASLHHSLMLELRTLLHLPWPLAIKLLIADTYALLTEELESGAWRLKRRSSARTGRS